MGGSRNARYTLKQQFRQALDRMASYGQSKHATAEAARNDKIFSYKTMKTYMEQTSYFARWLKQVHPETSNWHQGQQYVREYLEDLKTKTDSSWTLSTARAALNKVYGIKPGDKDFVKLPKRERSAITRSRGEAVRDKNFSERNNQEFVNFCRSTGLRRHELAALRGNDAVTRADLERLVEQAPNVTREQVEAHGETWDRFQKGVEAAKTALNGHGDRFAYVKQGKNGKQRFAPLTGKYAEQAWERMKDTPADRKVFDYLPECDIHSYRADYARAVYKSLSRPLDTLSRHQLYCCRGDMKGCHFDRAAMAEVSNALGHDRLCVVADNYLRGV